MERNLIAFIKHPQTSIAPGDGLQPSNPIAFDVPDWKHSGAARAAGLVTGATRTTDAELFQDNCQRAEFGEGRLQEVETDKRGEPKPVRAVVMRQHQAGEDERAGESANDHFHRF